MRLLILCLFFGIIFANTEESFEKLVQMIEGLKKEVDHLKQNNKKMGRFTELKNEIKKLNASMSDQELRILTNKEDLKVVDNLKTKVENQEERIKANEEDLKEVNNLKTKVKNQEATIQANEDGLDVSICYLIDKLQN